MTLLQRFGAALVGAAKIAEAELENFWNEKLEPWLLDLGHELEHDVTSTLIPFAAEALAEVSSGISGSGTIEERAAATGQALTLTLQKAAAAGIHTAEQDVTKEATTALASVIASVQKGAAAANQSVVAQVASIPAAP